MVDVEASSVDDVVTLLFRRVHLRNPKATELSHMRTLYTDIEDNGTSAQPAQDWAALSCYATLTMMESVFY